jgi:hypothetical protein
MRDDDPIERRLRQYLLGELPEEEAERLELEMLDDDELFDHAEALEIDLLDAVVREGLPPAQHRRMLAVAATPGGRSRLALVRGLAQIRDEEAAEEGSWGSFLRRFLIASPAWRTAVAAAALALLVGIPRLAHIPLPGPGGPPLPLSAATETVPISLLVQRDEKAPKPIVVSGVPALQVDVTEETAERFRITVRSPADHEVVSQELTAVVDHGARTATLVLDTRKLRPGLYEVSVEGLDGGVWQPVAETWIKIVRPGMQ